MTDAYDRNQLRKNQRNTTRGITISGYSFLTSLKMSTKPPVRSGCAITRSTRSSDGPGSASLNDGSVGVEVAAVVEAVVE